MLVYPYRILFIRHGETPYNAEGRLQGQRDIGLNGKGREQASAVGRTLRERWDAEIERLEAAGAFLPRPCNARARRWNWRAPRWVCRPPIMRSRAN